MRARATSSTKSNLQNTYKLSDVIETGNPSSRCGRALSSFLHARVVWNEPDVLHVGDDSTQSLATLRAVPLCAGDEGGNTPMVSGNGLNPAEFGSPFNLRLRLFLPGGNRLISWRRR